jgi:hypothetical protein
MRAAQIRRYLGAATQATDASAAAGNGWLTQPFTVRDADAPDTGAAPGKLEFSPHDYIAFLLSIDAEIEHCLMVQYLYAAYSLGGPQVPQQHRAMVRNWQEVILGVAKEEMGHLITVQNCLRLIGAPLHLDREDTPWDLPFYPFPFALEPLTLDSLAKYVYAEAPVGWCEGAGALGAEIKKRVLAQTPTPHQVSGLIAELAGLVANPDYLDDDAFDPSTCPSQADFAEWGRGYHEGQRGNTPPASTASACPAHKESKVPLTPDLLVQPQTCRDDMVAAINAIGQQGEASYGDAASHFVRFLSIYVELRDFSEQAGISVAQWAEAIPPGIAAATWASLRPDSHLGLMGKASAPSWSPSRKIAINPYVSNDPDPAAAPAPPVTSPAADAPGFPGAAARAGMASTLLTDPQTVLWAKLLNLRYRMLLSYLSHSFSLHGGLRAGAASTPRGTIINATFGEMYNLRALSEILMQSPVSASDADAGFAGPPFQMPYTLNSPIGERNRWRAHVDLLAAAAKLVEALLALAAPSQRLYLTSMRSADQKMQAQAKLIMSGSVDAALL